MDLERLHHILINTTVQLRKGAEVEHEQVGQVAVTRVYAMPHESEAPSTMEKVDCVFMLVGVDMTRAEPYRSELIALLDAYPEPSRLAGGPSYIEVGGVLGDQGAAFQLFALGEALGLWKVITPRTLGFKDEGEIREMAGRGLVMISGYKSQEAHEETQPRRQPTL